MQVRRSARDPLFAILMSLLFMSTPAGAQPPGEALKGFIHGDAVATVRLRSFYFGRTNPTPRNNVAWAGGGWVGYQSGRLYDTLQVGAVG